MICRARTLRRSLTRGETKLWAKLREFRRIYGIHARKQAPIGPYVADFAIQSRKLIIEMDGEHHFEPEAMERDAKRDLWFRNAGYRVVRLTIGEREEAMDGCVEKIMRGAGIL